MSRFRKYKITVEDEAHLRQMMSYRAGLPGAIGITVAFMGLAILIAGLLIAFTPLRTLLPGYLKESQREASEEGLLRLDSITEKYMATQAYIDNFLRITDVNRTSGDSLELEPDTVELATDSLMTPTARERRFVSQMEERERFNISVLAPLAAEGLIFSPVAVDAVFAADSRETETPYIEMPRESVVQAAADGSVVALYHSPADKGYVILIQHGHGFLTAYFGTGMPLTAVGDNVSSGQAIALPPGADAKGRRGFTLRMWHNGLPVAPYGYVTPPERRSATQARYEAPRGK